MFTDLLILPRYTALYSYIHSVTVVSSLNLAIVCHLIFLSHFMICIYIVQKYLYKRMTLIIAIP
jgi:hypothetical protein